MTVFLRKEREGLCRECYYYDKECPDDDCVNGKYNYIEDTIIPQKLALYEESIKMMEYMLSKPADALWIMRMQSIIDRAKKIDEATHGQS